MGTDVKLLSAACKLSGTSCNDLNISPPPISCAENKKHSGLVYPCTCGQCIHSSPFHSGNYVRSSSEPQHFISLSFPAFTSVPHSFGSLLPFHSASSINPVSHHPSSFPTHYQWYVLFSATSSPQKNKVSNYAKCMSLQIHRLPCPHCPQKTNDRIIVRQKKCSQR